MAEGGELSENRQSFWRFFNVVLLGFSFMLIFTAFQTCSMVEQSILEGAKHDTNGTFKGDGYTSLAIIYGVFAAANWAAPSVVAVLGPKISMMIGGVCYCLFILSFLKPMTWALYTGSVLVGCGAAIIWTGQGNFLTINSDSETIGRNSGVFWALLQCSLLIGNLYVYFQFKGEVVVTEHSRTILFIVLAACGGAGLLLLIGLRTGVTNSSDSVLNLNTSQNTDSKRGSALDALKKSFRLLITKEMSLLCCCFAYTGFELTFWSGVYGTSVGHTKHFGENAKRLIGLCGIFVGVGEILGGSIFGLFGKRTNKFGRDPIVLLGFILHMVAFYLIYLNLPNDSPLGETSQPTFFKSNEYLAVACAFLLGLGDSSFNTQIYSLLGFMYQEDSSPAFALFKFVQSLASAAAFFYSQYLLLQYQLLIMVVFGTVGTMLFFQVEWKVTKAYQEGYGPIAQIDVDEDTDLISSD